MKNYQIFRFGLASELIGITQLICQSDEDAIAEMSSARHAASALELWRGADLLMRSTISRSWPFTSAQSSVIAAAA